MNNEQSLIYNQLFEIKGGNFIDAGSASVNVKKTLKLIGIPSEIIYRISICCYEAEMNIIMYAYRATLDFSITPDKVVLKFNDEGPGIKDIELAMKEGYSTATSEMREMGFGAGMGLPNIKMNSDEFYIESEENKGTKLFIGIFIDRKPNNHDKSGEIT